MVSSFSTPVFPPVHAHPARLLSMDARFLAAIDSLVASMRADLRAIRDSDFALCKAVDYAVAPIRHNLALLRHDLALGVGEGSGPALMCSDAAASIALGHKTLQSVGQHDGVGSPLRISSVTPIDSVPPLLSSSPLLRALAISHVQPQSNDSVAATVSLLGSKTVIPDSVMPTTAQLLPDCSASMFSNLCKFSGNEFAPYTLFRKIGAEFRQAQPSIIANTCQKELVGMSARYVFDEIPGLCCCVVLDRDICYCKGIQDKGGGSNFRPLEDSRMRLGEKIVLSDYDDNIGNFIKKKLHVWCQVPSGLWELRMIRQHWFSTGVRGLVSAALLNDQLGWINWYLVGKFVKKDFYALELFEKMSEKGSEDKLEIFQGICATFHQYATSGPQLGNELSQFKNVEFDHVTKEIQNVGVRWISLPTASILLLLFEEMTARRLYGLVPNSSANEVYLMNESRKNGVRLRNFSRPTNSLLSQEIACCMGRELGWIMIKGLADEEIYVQLPASVRGCDVYLVQPTCPPANENFIEVIVMSGACRPTAGRTIHEYMLKVRFTGNSQVTNAQLDPYAKSEDNIIHGISYNVRTIPGFAYTYSLFKFLVVGTSFYSTIETSSVLSSCVRQPKFILCTGGYPLAFTPTYSALLMGTEPHSKRVKVPWEVQSDVLHGMHFKEHLQSLQDLEEIIEALDGITVARVDLVVEIPLEQIPTVPEELTNVYRQLNKLVTVAYQFLELVIEYPTPTHDKVANVSEAVRQYAFNIVRGLSIVESPFDAFSQQWFSVKLIYAFCCLLIFILGIVGMHYVVNLVGSSEEPIKSMAAIESIALVLAYSTNKRIITLLLYYGGRIGHSKEYREKLLGKWEVVDVNDCCSSALNLVDSGKIYGKHLYNTTNFHVKGSSTVSSSKPVIFADETCATQTAALGNANFALVFVQGSLTSVRNRYQLLMWAVVHTADEGSESIADTQTKLQLMELGEVPFLVHILISRSNHESDGSEIGLLVNFVELWRHTILSNSRCSNSHYPIGPLQK